MIMILHRFIMSDAIKKIRMSGLVGVDKALLKKCVTGGWALRSQKYNLDPVTHSLFLLPANLM